MGQEVVGVLVVVVAEVEVVEVHLAARLQGVKVHVE